MKKTRKIIRLRDAAISIGILALASVLCVLLQKVDGSDRYVPLIFILATLLVSRFTDGYIYGIAASFISVIAANYVFTYPYLAFNFTISGYPITFICLLVTSIITSTLTTQIKRQEKIRMEAEKEKMRGNLLRAVSHDLRTPLTSIVGATSAVLDNEDVLTPEKRRELLTEVRDDAQWLIRMVENLLSVTRMNEGITKITKTDEAVEEIAGEAVRKFKKRFPEAKVAVSVPDALLIVPMDAMLIEQVLINLLENAVLHGKNPEGIKLQVRAEENSAVFAVSDQGVGIPEAVFPHIFDGHFEKSVGDESSDSKRNMGIGLSVCMSIIRAHGGEMTAENMPAGGAVFTFALPYGEGNFNGNQT